MSTCYELGTISLSSFNTHKPVMYIHNQQQQKKKKTLAKNYQNQSFQNTENELKACNMVRRT